MNNLQLIKSSKFGEVECDFYQNDKGEMFITRNQIGRALEYSNPNTAITKLHSRYKKRLDKFSVCTDMVGTDGKVYNTYIYSARGIYEICRHSEQPKADAFYDWVYDILESLRKGEVKIIKPTNEQIELLNIKKQNADARLRNAKVREAKFLLEVVDRYKNILAEQSVELLTINALEVINGKETLVKPKLQNNKYYSATEIGEELGISANKVGKIANANNLKTDDYGKTVLSKSLYSAKQCPTFMYNEKGKQKIIELVMKNNTTTDTKN